MDGPGRQEKRTFTSRVRARARFLESMYRRADLESWLAKQTDEMRGRAVAEPTMYRPQSRQAPPRVLEAPSCWAGIESILPAILSDFRVKRQSCLEFGVENGYSTVALSGLFESVTGVDTFLGDQHAGKHEDTYAKISASLAHYENIRLVQSDFRQWIANDQATYDLIHVDIVHTYSATLACGLWSAQHAPCVIFHDTESFPAVRQSVATIARTLGRSFYNFPEFSGLGILVPQTVVPQTAESTLP